MAHCADLFTRRRLVALAAVGAWALSPIAGPSPATARGYPFNVFHYRVRYQGSGTYTVTDQGNGGSVGQVLASFHWRVRYDLLFVHHRGHQLGAIAQLDRVGAGTWSISLSNTGGQDCSGAGGLRLNQYGAIAGSIQHDGSLVMTLFPGAGDYSSTRGSSGPSACHTADFWRDWVEGFSKLGAGTQAVDPLTAVVLVKPTQLKRKRLAFAVSNRSLFASQLTASPDCGLGDGSCSQSFGWRGSVTLTKLGRR